MITMIGLERTAGVVVEGEGEAAGVLGDLGHEEDEDDDEEEEEETAPVRNQVTTAIPRTNPPP